MTVSYIIRATVVDIRSDKPQRTDRFLVDSNVWYWYVYNRAFLFGRPYQTNLYPEYVRKAAVVGATLLFAVYH